MPINKAAQIRLEILDECLRNSSRKWSKTDLLAYVNRRLLNKFGPEYEVSISQLRYDLHHLESEYNAPIEIYKEGRYYHYRYQDTSFSIKNIAIPTGDFDRLHTAIDILSQIKGFTIADEIAEIIARIEQKCKHEITTDEAKVIFDHTPYTKGVEQLEDIYRSITQKSVLKIRYQSYSSQLAGTYIVHPYLLKEYKHRWYLLGLNDNRKNIGTFAIDRITDVRVCNTKYIENTSLNAKDYFDDIIGVTRPGKGARETIHLVFSSVIAPYIISQPLHHNQSIIEYKKDGSLHISLNLIINHELINLLLGFGKEVTVLAPEVLSLEMRSAALMLLHNYAQQEINI